METLHSQLTKQGIEYMPPLPRKRLFSSASDQAIQERREAFQEVLTFLVVRHGQNPTVLEVLPLVLNHSQDFNVFSLVLWFAVSPCL